MRIRPLLIFTAILSSLLGAVIAYFVLTVPNDLEAGTLLKLAHRDLQNGKTGAAHATLTKIVQQYPRTDAAAAATVGLVRIGETEREKLERVLTALSRENQRQTQLIAALQKAVEEIRSTPPKVVTVQAPAPKKPPPKKKPAPAKRRKR